MDIMNKAISINGGSLRLEEFENVVFSGAPVELTETARTKLRNSRQVVEEILKKGDPVFTP